ncbi:hypothetical protein CPB84DRAFT_1742125 [Gymnopilus junonius]|uniref:Uncharacterized protein n=1 Tax=Gymnopilus junonius TaxID=109634 RepID=A0A9P5P596_GYMJU|nr:hypothetical protein CPB84DRAFT_1742125 [Gymnopilus junonius]
MTSPASGIWQARKKKDTAQPKSHSIEDGTKVARSCLEIFIQSGIINVNFEIRESVITLLGGPEQLVPTFTKINATNFTGNDIDLGTMIQPHTFVRIIPPPEAQGYEVKHDNGTGLAIGHSNGIRSCVRNYYEDDATCFSMERVILHLDNNFGAFFPQTTLALSSPMAADVSQVMLAARNIISRKRLVVCDIADRDELFSYKLPS